jgi:hypothetical protein
MASKRKSAPSGTGRRLFGVERQALAPAMVPPPTLQVPLVPTTRSATLLQQPGVALAEHPGTVRIFEFDGVIS